MWYVVVCEVVEFHLGWCRVRFLLYEVVAFVPLLEVAQDVNVAVRATVKNAIMMYSMNLFLPIVSILKAANIQYYLQPCFSFNIF